MHCETGGRCRGRVQCSRHCNAHPYACLCRGQNVLHTLARCGQENAAAIFSVLLAAVPNFPLNAPDIDGNNGEGCSHVCALSMLRPALPLPPALLLAYFSGHTALCDALVRSGAHPGMANKQSISIFNTPVSTKQLLLRILG